MHHPIFIKSDREDFDIPALLEYVLPVIKKSSLDMILVGHEHLQMFSIYNKTKPLEFSKDDTNITCIENMITMDNNKTNYTEVINGVEVPVYFKSQNLLF